MSDNKLVNNGDVNDDESDSQWILELESALLADCDLSIIKKITNQRIIPDSMRCEYWNVCLEVKGHSEVLEDIFDLPEQNQIRDDCKKLVQKLGNDESDFVSVLSDLETIVTTFSKRTSVPYACNNGWLEILEPLLALTLNANELYNYFVSIHKRYIPKLDHTSVESANVQSPNNINCQSYHFFRLLLLYHDPELCSYLDTKKITPDLYAYTWFRSLLSAHSNLKVTHALWDVYFTLNNTFLIYFLALVMLVNAKEQIMLELKDANRESIIDFIGQLPRALSQDDIGDLFYLVEQHFVSRTPCTIRYFTPLLFQSSPSSLSSQIYGNSSGDDSSVSLFEPQISDLSHLLCLPVPAADLLPNASNANAVRYFVVDCRPADQYNNGHLSTAFHLDCSLMLHQPAAFTTAVEALLAAQRSSIDARSVAGGHHLCFMGSGRDEEDQYVHMVVASFLQKNHQFVSLAYGGYASLHRIIMMNGDWDRYIIDHNRKHCIDCVAGSKGKSKISLMSRTSSGDSSPNSTIGGVGSASDVEHFTSALFDKLATAVKTKTTEMREKIVEYVTNQQGDVERHVSSRDKLGKRYKGSNRYTLEDDENEDDGLNGDDDEERGLEIDMEKWVKNDDVIGHYKCQEIKDDGYMCPSYLVLTKTHLIILREIPHNKGYAKIIAKRPLEMIVQITSKRRCPDLITFKYGETSEASDSAPNVVAMDHLLIPQPYEVTRLIKQQVIRILDGDINSNSASGI